jgi:hypothetical protein
MVRAALAAALASLTLAACASTPPAPPPPPGGPVLSDWRGVVTAFDRDRYQRRQAAWDLALQQARRQPGSGDLRGLGELIDPDAQRPLATPPVGNYRCRTVKLGSQGGEDGLGYVVYGWFACRIEQTPRGLKFVKLTGSQRPSGLLFPESDLIGVLERIGERRWRLVLPWPQNESNLDLIELVPGA